MKDTTTAKAELTNDLDIVIHDATVDLLDGRLMIMADRFGVTLDEAVVAAIRDEFNLVYRVLPRTDRSVFVTRDSDSMTAIVVESPRDPRTFTGTISLLGDLVDFRGHGPSVIAAAKAVFAEFDAAVQSEAKAAV